jgi:hypothetical protein
MKRASVGFVGCPHEGRQFGIEARRMAAAFLDFNNTDELIAVVKRGEAPPPSASRRKGKSTEPVWSRVHLERFSAPSIISPDEPTTVENLETLV